MSLYDWSWKAVSVSTIFSYMIRNMYLVAIPISDRELRKLLEFCEW